MTAREIAECWVDNTEHFDECDWTIESLDLSELVGLRLSSCDVGFPTSSPMSLEDWKEWFQEELEHQPFREWMLDPEVFDPKDELQEIVLSFDYDEKGKYLIVWDGHHRIAAALARGLRSMKVVVGE